MNKDGTSMNMDPELAKKLLAQGAVLLIAGVPVGTDFGIDLCAYTIGPNFRGVKMIPPGPHFVWCASQGLYGDVAPRVGFVHYFKANEIIVREWDNDIEELRERRTDNPELEKQRIRSNLQYLERLLAPYDYRYFKQWQHLTDSITAEGVQRCRPALGTVRTNVELQSCTDAERPRGGRDDCTLAAKAIALQKCKFLVDENELLPDLKPIEGTAPRFTELPQRVPRDALAADLTRHALDCIVAVDTLMQNFPDANAVIEELQLAFAFFLVGCSVESLAQWRKLLAILAHSESAVVKYKLLYMKYSEVLAQQLPYLPDELMVASERNTVYKDVRTLLINLHAAGLRVSAEFLTKRLQKTLHWVFDNLLEEDPEEQPVIVEMIENVV